MTGRRPHPPFGVPKAIAEWKRRADTIWTTKTGLVKYWTMMASKTNLDHCNQFVKSMRERSEDEPNPAGYVDGILVEYSSRYLHVFFGWDGTGATQWSPSCSTPRPDIPALVKNTPPEPDGTYDVFALGKVLDEPWFSRIRGILSQVFFRNNTNRVSVAQLEVMFLADQEEKVNWGFLVDEHFRVQLRAHGRIHDYLSPIGPFLSAYIAHYLSFHRRNGRAPTMGTFLDVQQELAKELAPPFTQPTPSLKRQRVLELGTGGAMAKDPAWGPRTSEIHAHTVNLTETLEGLLQFIHQTEQGLTMAHREQEERAQRKAAHTIQTIQEQSARNLEAVHAEYKQQLDEAQCTLTNLRNRISNLELELTNAQEHLDSVAKEKAWLQEKAEKLEQKNAEYLTRCKTLTEEQVASIGQPAAGDLERLSRERQELEQARENFEINKAGWIQDATGTIASCAYRILRAQPPTTEDPPQEFMEKCINEAMATLDMEQSDNDWEDMEFTLLTEPPQEITSKGKEAYLSPPRVALASSLNNVAPGPSQPGPVAPDVHDPAERVDIPDQITDTEDTPQPSPHHVAVVAEAPSQPLPSVNSRPKPIKFHKDALKKLEEEYNLEVPASDDSDAEDDLQTAIFQVKQYFQANPDLANRYADPEADQVQCTACNKLLGKTVYDVYQHSSTSRSTHNLIHRGVAAAIAALYDGQAPPRRHAQLPREATRPDRRPAHRRTKT